MQPPDWMTYFWFQFGYLGVFLVSFIGASSIFIPVPYTILVFWLGFLEVGEPLYLMLAGGLGAALGEFTGYLLGFYGQRILSAERKRKMEFLVKLFGRYGPLAIFIFALTPLPDDLLFIPLGIMHYKFIKAFIPALLGKMLMIYLLAYFGRLGSDIILVIFGAGNEWIGMVITAVLLFAVLVVLFRIDWEKLFRKYAAKRGETKN